MSEEPRLVPVFIPALVVLLTHAESQKGEPLTEAEVLAIRDRAACMQMSEEHAHAFAERRGADLAPERCWEEWQRLREERA